MSPLAHALPRWYGLRICKFIALQLAVEIMYGPAWQQQRDPHTEMKCISLGYALYCPAWPEQTWAMLFETIDMMPLVSYPGLRDQFLSFMGAANSGFFSCVSTASCKCWGKNGQGKSLGDTRIKNTVRSIVSQACVAGKANSKSLACFYIPTYQC